MAVVDKIIICKCINSKFYLLLQKTIKTHLNNFIIRCAQCLLLTNIWSLPRWCKKCMAEQTDPMQCERVWICRVNLESWSNPATICWYAPLFLAAALHPRSADGSNHQDLAVRKEGCCYVSADDLLLPGVLDALRCCVYVGSLWKEEHGFSHSGHHSIILCEVQHSLQPPHLHLHEQKGLCLSVFQIKKKICIIASFSPSLLFINMYRKHLCSSLDWVTVC